MPTARSVAGYANRAGDAAGTTIDAPFATVGGGHANRERRLGSTIAGGSTKTRPAAPRAWLVGGSSTNTSSAATRAASVEDKKTQQSSSFYSSVGGGISNTASGSRSTIGGGDANTADNKKLQHRQRRVCQRGQWRYQHCRRRRIQQCSRRQTVLVRRGGTTTRPAVTSSTVAGGDANIASGDYKYRRWRPRQNLSPMAITALRWDVGPQGGLRRRLIRICRQQRLRLQRPTASDNFRVRAQRVAFASWSTSTVPARPPGAADWSTAGGSWVCSSDRNQKQDLDALDGQVVLDKLAAMPVYAWSPKAAIPCAPRWSTAQDFHAAFGLGDTDLGIGQQDADGVAMAAIQGLNAKLEAELPNSSVRSPNCARTPRPRSPNSSWRKSCRWLARRRSRGSLHVEQAPPPRDHSPPLLDSSHA